MKTIRLKESSSLLVESDASAYGVGEFGILPDTDKRIISTVSDIFLSLKKGMLNQI